MIGGGKKGAERRVERVDLLTTIALTSIMAKFLGHI